MPSVSPHDNSGNTQPRTGLHSSGRDDPDPVRRARNRIDTDRQHEQILQKRILARICIAAARSGRTPE